MEKLSSILPSNARLKSVDLEDAHPVRPGIPTHGRPVGMTSSQRDRITISPQAKENAFNETLARKNPRMDKNAEIVKTVTDNFFNKRVGPKVETDFTPSMTEQVAQAQVDNIIVPETIPTPSPAYSSAGKSAETVSLSGQLVDKNA